MSGFEMTLTLSHSELIELTHRTKYSAQRRALNMMQIDFKVRPDGTIAVFRDSYNAVQARKQKRVEPNWGAVR